MSETCGSQAFDDVLVEWVCQREGPSCEVKVFWMDSLLIRISMSRAQPRVPFSAVDEDSKQEVSGVLILRGEELLIDLDYPGGEVSNYRLWPSGPPTPPSPPPPEQRSAPPEIGISINDASDYDLFPYVYLRTTESWPAVSTQDLEDRFVGYNEKCNHETKGRLSYHLRKDSGDRDAMTQDAIHFLNGTNPYQGQFLGLIENLMGPIRGFSSLDRVLRLKPPVDLAEFKKEVSRSLGLPWEEVRAYVEVEPEYRIQLDRAWQNLFALTIILGFDQRLLDDVIPTVVIARLLDRVVESEPENPPDGMLPLFPPWIPERIRDGIWATVNLPDDIFPLPKASPEPEQKSPDAPSTIHPYAIGDLQLVRQRLDRYELGEVSAIENILQGETKETTRRILNRTAEASDTTVSEDLEEGNSLFGTRADLIQETERTLSLDFSLQFQTQYGPPQEGKATGHLTMAPDDGAKQKGCLTEEATRLARQVTARTENRMTRRVLRRRSTSSLDENEETVVTRFDGTNSQQHTRGIYRWVNKVYKAWVVNYGNRLILECFVREPARAFINEQESLRGISFAQPIAPAELGLETFRDISTDPESKTLYYGELAARYEATDVTPPPPAVEIVGATLQLDAEVQIQNVWIPEGYRAARAHIAVNCDDDAPNAEVFGIVGRQPFQLNTSGSEKTCTITTNEERGVVPITIASRVSSPDPAGARLPGEYLVAVQIETTRDGNFEEWQIATYNSIVAAYRRQRDRFYGVAGTAPGRVSTRNPRASRDVVRKELKKDLMRSLLSRAERLTGETKELFAGEPRYFQFFEQAFEWNEMSFSFTVRTGDSPSTQSINRYPGEDELFTAFLEAGCARVLLPVRPGDALITLYFLASGMIWNGRDELTPATKQTVALINELKTLHDNQDQSTPSRSESWDVRVPTSMVMLQPSSTLPGFTPKDN